jgi:hypothetical protein
MRNNKAILDEAARSVRRTFIGSVAGSVTMLAVVGAAGAYGMPEKLTAQALSAAMAKLNFKFAPQADHAEVLIERPVRVAENTKPMAGSPVTDVTPEDVAPVTAKVAVPIAPEAPAVRTMPQVEPAEIAAPAAPPVAVAPVAAAPIVAEPAVAKPPVTKSAVAETVVAKTIAAEPAPATTASLTPIVHERPLIPAPMVFEAPKAADAQVLTEVPNAELVVTPPAPPAPVAPKPSEKPVAAPATPVRQASLAPEPVAAEPAAEFPKSVMLRLPVPKPPLTPAQRLELQGKDYDKAEKCLAQAVYFEARNEPARGQQAVAQVVLNRVFSPYYPKDVCSVVYQNAHRHLSCQFTFACDGKPELVNERGAWARANRVAKQTLDAKVWLPEVNKATHYHAAYVRPNWIRDMKVMVRYGLHTFYRPRNWGDGSNEAHWGTAANSVKPAAVAAKPVAAAAASRKMAPRRAYARYTRA